MDPAGDPSRARALIGRMVEARLRSAGAQVAQGNGMKLWYVPDFLPQAGRDFLIERIEYNRQRSALLDDVPVQEGRTSDSSNLDRWDERVRAVDRRICALMGLDERRGETLQGQRYAPDQYFRPHHDYFRSDQSYWPAQQAMGGQRTWTAMIFLNAPEAGGDTYFPDAGMKVAPLPGLLLMWDNMKRDGAPNPKSLHEGCTVEAGVKYIVTKWFREGFWA
jgi:prolyl 4-hydroxylase